ncbi:uncharacterized protein MCAP_0864-like isoform X2 [Nilaparvata lugens]|nr:uncharacterized protein MCAP_0864-like isoform X2 [Nilaparvata lugens]
MDYRKAIKTALQGYDEQTISLERQLAIANSELKKCVELLKIREEQISSLESVVEELTSNSLKMEEKRKKEDDITIRELRIAVKEKDDQLARQTESISSQLQEIRQSNIISIQNIVRESTSQINNLESQIFQLKSAEQSYKDEIEKLKETLNKKELEFKTNKEHIFRQGKEITKFKKDMVEICEVRSSISQKLKQSEATIQSLQEQKVVLQDDNNRMKCEMVERIRSLEVLLEANMNRNRDSQSQIMNALSLVSEDCCTMKSSLRRVSGEAFAESVSIGVQVKLNFDDICFEDTIITLKRKITQMTQNEIQQSQQMQLMGYQLQDMEEENNKLRGVVGDLRRMKLEDKKEKQEEEDERRIQRIEDGIVRLKSHIGVQNSQEALPHLLNDIRGELAELKGKSWYKVVRHPTTAVCDAREVDHSASSMSIPTCVVQHSSDQLPTHVPRMEESLARSKQRNRVKFAGPIQNMRIS